MISNSLYKKIKWVEIAIAVILLVALIIIGIRMTIELFSVTIFEDDEHIFDKILSGAFSLVVGVEFVKMLIKSSAENVLEVIMFTVARALIAEDTTMLHNFLGVAALALIFIIRKFWFCEVLQSDMASQEKDMSEPLTGETK